MYPVEVAGGFPPVDEVEERGGRGRPLPLQANFVLGEQDGSEVHWGARGGYKNMTLLLRHHYILNLPGNPPRKLFGRFAILYPIC